MEAQNARRRPVGSGGTNPAAMQQPLDSAWLRELCRAAGADDVGFVEIDRPAMAVDRADILAAAPWTRTLITFVLRWQRENIRSPMRSLANQEFHAGYDRVIEVSRTIVERLSEDGVRAMHTVFGFPMEMDRWPAKPWIVSHKLAAEAAGLGRMGIHRNVIHPTFGSFVAIGTVLIDRDVDQPSRPIDYNPCLSCKLCVAACPTGAIKSDGDFDFSACYTHNYRELMSGFGDWVEQVADSGSAREYRKRVSDDETVSMWQSLAFKPNYKAAYCVSVCPAGTDVLGPFEADKKGFVDAIVRPFQEKTERVYVVPGSDAEKYVPKRFPRKSIRPVSHGLRARTIDQFLFALPLLFQRDQSRDLNAVYHFTFTGAESRDATVIIRDQELDVRAGHHGEPDLRLRADTETWLGYLAREKSLLPAVLRGRIRVRGPLRLMKAFARCFPS